jgi:hypothetical protein
MEAGKAVIGFGPHNLPIESELGAEMVMVGIDLYPEPEETTFKLETEPEVMVAVI